MKLLDELFKKIFQKFICKYYYKIISLYFYLRNITSTARTASKHCT